MTNPSPLNQPIPSAHEATLSPAERAAQDRRFSAQRRISAAQRALGRALGARDDRERQEALIDAAGIVGDLRAPSAQEAARLLDRAVTRGLDADAAEKVKALLKEARRECSEPRERLRRAATLIRTGMGFNPDPASGSYECDSNAPDISNSARAAIFLRAEDYLVDTHGAKGPLTILREGDAFTALLNLESEALKLTGRRD